MKHVTATVKKSFALVLALVLALGMTACGNGESSSSGAASSAASSEVSSEAVSSEAVSSEETSSEAARAESAAGEETTGSKTITLTVVHGDGTSNDITVSTDAENLRDALEAEGRAGYVYTQLTDVEEETNGLLTYDRCVNKLAPGDSGRDSGVELAT